MSTEKKHVIVGISGGVDSSVSALLLKQQGFTVSGLFMKNWEEDDTEDYCSASQDIADAQAVCDSLDIPLHKVNFAAEYWDDVFTYFLREYEMGRTPNPDILCNKYIKFRAFLEHAKKLGADLIATGHYARVRHQHENYQLLTGLDNNKDQTYFLYTLGQAQLAQALFPLGELTKPEVRKIAKEANLVTHKKKDSTGICFIGERKFKTFLQTYLPAKPGPIITDKGEEIGQHDGLMYYTIGQRKGLNIGGRQDAKQAPWYVAKKDIKNNTLIIVQDEENPLLFKQELICEQLHWVAGNPPDFQQFTATAKTRYRQRAEPCHVMRQNKQQWLVTFDEPQRAITPGQSVVFYQDDVCLGGGIIG